MSKKVRIEIKPGLLRYYYEVQIRDGRPILIDITKTYKDGKTCLEIDKGAILLVRQVNIEYQKQNINTTINSTHTQIQTLTLKNLVAYRENDGKLEELDPEDQDVIFGMFKSVKL